MSKDSKQTTSAKLGRNSDGTFAKDNQLSVGNNGGRPKDDFSYRAIAKKQAAKNPARIKKDLKKLDEIIDDPDSTPLEISKALDIKIKLNGGYDAQETKSQVTGEIATTINERPFEGLTAAELRKLIK
ncbi:MAG: hypothetical protein Q4E47_03365 [Candidatus Saccharibacteria bacterium]|nr:hypothetical protein [Candidatus Saccharibacteria bacterium]